MVRWVWSHSAETFTSSERFELPIRIVVVDPVPGLSIALQRGQAAKAELIPPAGQSEEAVVFDIEVMVDGRLADGRPRLLGPVVQGPPKARFVYLAVGTYASQTASSWGGRIKVPLSGLSWDQMEAPTSGQRLVARIPSRAPKGGPALASVPLLAPGWQVDAPNRSR
jgi:hypothetical protein